LFIFIARCKARMMSFETFNTFNDASVVAHWSS
jgi:hypothetical protein